MPIQSPTSFFDKYKTPTTPDFNMTGPDGQDVQPLKAESNGPLDAALQGVQSAGGSLLTNTVKGVSAIGQSIMGAFDYLENNKGAYDKLFGDNGEGTTDNAGSFHWDRLAGFAGGAVTAGFNQGQRILQSNNLTELGQNAYTGVDILKNLPGDAGEFYRNTDSKAVKTSLAIAGFGLEVLLDPTAKIAGGAYKVGAAVGKYGAEAGVLGERAADQLGRVAANAATGNWIGGAVAGGARETAFAARAKLLDVANKYQGQRLGKAAGTVLEWAMGPMSLATSDVAKSTLSKYIAMQGNAGTDLQNTAANFATAISSLPNKQQSQAQSLMRQFVGEKDADVQSGILDEMAKLGVNRNTAAGLGARYLKGNMELIDVLDSASNTVPALKGITDNMDAAHIRQSYRMYVDPKVQRDWLDHLVTQNTPGSWQLKNTQVGQQLMEGLGITEPTAITIGGAKNTPEGANVTFTTLGSRKSTSPAANVSTSTVSSNSGTRQAQLLDQIQYTDELIASAGPGADISSYTAIRDKYTQQVEALDKMTAGTGPNQFASKKINSLQNRIDMLDSAIDRSTQSNIDKLTARRNAFQGQLEKEIAKVQAGPANSGNPTLAGDVSSEPTVGWVKSQTDRISALQDQLGKSTDGAERSQIRAEINRISIETRNATGFKGSDEATNTVRAVSRTGTATKNGGLDDFLAANANNTGDNSVRAIAGVGGRPTTPDGLSGLSDFNRTAADGISTPTEFRSANLDTSGINKAPISAEDAFSFKNELAQSGDTIYIPSLGGIQKATRLQFHSDLQDFIANSPDIQQSSLVGFKKGDNGEMLADFAQRQQTARATTLADIHNFTSEWGAARNLPQDDIDKMSAAVTNSLVYVPGSREFVSMVRDKKTALSDLDPQLKSIVDNNFSKSVDLSSIQDRTLDPVWHDLFGKIDDFSVSASQQALALSPIAAKAKLLSEMRKNNLILTEDEITSNPDYQKLGGWVDVSDGFKGAGDTNKYMMQTTNKQAIDAIDRSFSDMNVLKGLTMASNLFRSAALKTDPSAHATQFLGNLAMLQMMGMKKVFGDDVNLVSGMSHSFKSAMLVDDHFKDAVDAGVAVASTLLDNQQAPALARNLLSLPRIATSGDKQGAMTNIFRMAEDVFTAGQKVASQGSRRAINSAANGLSNIPALGEGTDALNAANLLTSSGAMFQLSDKMTRLFAYRAALQNSTKGLVKANPVLANFTQEGTRINWDALSQHVEAGSAPGITSDTVKALKETHDGLRSDAAAIANDVALNYNDVPAAVNYLSKTGIVPFIKFQWKATGRVMQFIDERPWAFSPYYAAQRNINAAVNPDPDNLEQQRQGLSPAIRDALVIPTGGKDSMGRQEFVDLSRWLPFGMYASTANGGSQDAGLTSQPNQLVSTPITDLYASFTNPDAEKPQGQSMASYMAQKLAGLFSPAGVGVGSRKVVTLANAIQQSMHYVDTNGQVVDNTPNLLEKGIMNYANLPAQVGQVLTEAGNSLTGNPTHTTALGDQKDPTAYRPRTTVQQAIGRYAVPGVGFSSDIEKSAAEYQNRYDARISQLTKLRSSVINAAGPNITPAQGMQVDRINQQIDMLKQQASATGSKLLLGE